MISDFKRERFKRRGKREERGRDQPEAKFVATTKKQFCMRMEQGKGLGNSFPRAPMRVRMQISGIPTIRFNSKFTMNNRRPNSVLFKRIPPQPFPQQSCISIDNSP